jgi:hypothetical protein
MRIKLILMSRFQSEWVGSPFFQTLYLPTNKYEQTFVYSPSKSKTHPMAAQIPLPAQIQLPYLIQLPALPANPPTNADYAAAVDYIKRVDQASRNGLYLFEIELLGD